MINLNELRDRAYKCACNHGFHDIEYSDEKEIWVDIPEYEESYPFYASLDLPRMRCNP